MYGLTLLVAILACNLADRPRWTALGGEWDLVTRVAVWGVGFGVSAPGSTTTSPPGARCRARSGRAILEVWKGGLGVWGGILFGALAGAVVVRRAGASVAGVPRRRRARACCSPRAIGRIGNWWNQELYGKPTKLPWGLEIDARRTGRSQYFDNATFHPTFLYELIWNLIGVGVLLWVATRFTIQPPALFALYVAWYMFGRFFEELLRDRPVAPHRRPAPERVGLDHPLRASVELFRLAPVRAPGRGVREPRREPPQGPGDGDPEGRRVR